MRKVLLVLSYTTAAASLIVGMGSLWRLGGLAVIGLLAILWAVKSIRRSGWLASGSLAVYMCAAAGSLVGGGQAVWLIVGVFGALASWDLINFERNLAGTEQNEGLRHCEQEHLKNLGIAIGLGSIVVFPMLLIRIHLSFILMLTVLAGALAGLVLALRFLQKKNTP